MVISKADSEKEFNSFFASFNDVFVIVLTAFYAISLVAFPIFGIYKILKNFEILGDEDFYGRYEYLISDLVLTKRSTTMYHMFFVITRIIISFTLIFMRNVP